MTKPLIFDDACVPPGISQIAIDPSKIVAMAEAVEYNNETQERTKKAGIVAIYMENREAPMFVHGDFTKVGHAIWGDNR